MGASSGERQRAFSSEAPGWFTRERRDYYAICVFLATALSGWARRALALDSDDGEAASLLLVCASLFTCDDTRGPDDWPQGIPFLSL